MRSSWNFARTVFERDLVDIIGLGLTDKADPGGLEPTT
jgi:hypothetical protein